VPFLMWVFIVWPFPTRALAVLQIPPSDPMRLPDLLLLRCSSNLLCGIIVNLLLLIELMMMLLMLLLRRIDVVVMARESQQLIIIFVDQVESKHWCTVARLWIALPTLPIGIQEISQTGPEMLPYEIHKIGIILRCISILIN
jgi:hypothetical protein